MGEAPGWYHAEDLDPGDQLRTPTGDKVRVVDLRGYTATTTVHNLTINGVHTYCVQAGGNPVLVHNTGHSFGRDELTPDQFKNLRRYEKSCLPARSRR